MPASLPQPPVEPALPGDVEVTELVLLLPAGHVEALAETARRRGLTMGQILRGLVRDFLAGPEQALRR